MPVNTLEGLVWYSLVYQPHGPVDDVAGPDPNTRCESPVHRFGEPRPPAEWVEMLGYPSGDASGVKSVARCWKTCEACHVAMARVGEKHREGAQRPGSPHWEPGRQSEGI